MTEILVLMTTGIVIGYIFKNKTGFIRIIEKLTGYSIFLLLFLLGMSVGANEQVISGFGKIGVNALILSLSGTAGSILLSVIVFSLFFKKGKIS